ncbi:hypothetical protein FQA39_LY13425 [Lamprigera yunnana]|nr:hypothetical protein FQA39_LY13425 [Lamprigera yunnana]
MWMLYTAQHWTKAIDLKSVVERLYEKIGALEFDPDHEAIYGMEKYYTVEECEQLRDKYKIGRKKDYIISNGDIQIYKLQHAQDTSSKLVTPAPDATSKLVSLISSFLLTYTYNSFTVDEKEPDTTDKDENIQSCNCELVCEADTDYNNYEIDRDVKLTTNDEETKNSDYELFCETDNNKKDTFKITGRRLINTAYFL